MLVLLAGLNAPLGLLALSLAAALAPLSLRQDLLWLASPALRWLWSVLLVGQFLADLYFVPATVKDGAYLQRSRIVNAYLHARIQSFFRPLVAALVLAALLSPLQAQTAAILGFVGGTAIYWSTAWVREQVAMSRGAVFLLIVEMVKNLVALGAAVLAAVFAPFGLALLVGFCAPVALWATRLRRERSLYPAYGGGIAPEDS